MDIVSILVAALANSVGFPQAVGLFAIPAGLLTFYAAYDASRWPDSAWRAVGEKKKVWVAAMTLGFLAAGLGFGAAAYYFVTLRPQLDAAASART